MRRTRLTAALIGLSTTLGTAHAQISPPVAKTVKPAGAPAGETVTFTIEGTGLDRASEIVLDEPGSRSIRTSVTSSSDQRVEASLTLPKETPSGPIAFRVVSPRGLSNALRFDVSRPGSVMAEVEPNDGFRKPQAVPSPCTIEGKIQNGMDVDVFAVEARAGETLVAEVVAARAGSTLDPTLTIFAPDGRELATVDDLFGRDAAVAARVSRSGRYFVQVVDANGRNRDGMAEAKLQANRTYRLTLGTIPLLISVDPPGLRRGAPTRLRLLGANVPPETSLALPEETPLGDFPFQVAGSNSILLRVGDLPEIIETEPDDRADQAVAVAVPSAINGRFERKTGGDVDHYRLRPADGRAGDYAITVHAARIGSPADPVLAVVGDDARIVAEDDDKLGRDARIERRIEPGGLLLGVREYYGRGGDRFVYRIEAEPLAPWRLVADLGGRTVPRRGRVAIPIEVERRGVEGPITLLPGLLPTGLSAAPITIAAGSKRGLLILSAEATATLGAFPLRLVARDVAGPVEWAIPGSIEGASMFAVAEPVPLDLTIEPAALTLVPGSEAELTIRLDRRGDAAKGAVKVALRSLDGDLSGLEIATEPTFAANISERTIRLKAKVGAAPRRDSLVAIARFEATPEGRGVASNPSLIIVREETGREESLPTGR